MKKIFSIICNIIIIVCSSLIYVFLSQPYFTLEISGGWIEGKFDLLSGYEIIQNFTESSDSKTIMLAVSLILITIFASFIIFCSLLNLLKNFEIIKNKKVYKFSNFINIISSVLMFVFVIIGFFIMIDMVNTEINLGIKISWASVINLVLSFIIILLTILSYVFSKKTKKINKKFKK